MNCIYYDQFQGPISLQQQPDPTPGQHGVVVKIEATGLCRSDWHGWMGHDEDITLPHVPGHELAGVIVEVGNQIRNWQIGDRVTVPFVGGCGKCPECASGNHQVCPDQFQPGFTAWGSFAEFVAIDYADTNLVRLPESMTFETAASLGCRFATSFRAVVDQGQLKPGQWLAVYGCGGVGLSAIMIGRALGAQVIAVDIQEKALNIAKLVGADHCINSFSTPNLAEAVQDISGGGAHVSIDALGHPEILHNSMMNLRRRGKHIQVGILPPEQVLARIPVDRVIAYELEILGSHGMQAHRYPEMLNMITSGKMDPSMLIQQRIKLKEVVTALPKMDSFEHAGVIIIDAKPE